MIFPEQAPPQSQPIVAAAAAVPVAPVSHVVVKNGCHVVSNGQHHHARNNGRIYDNKKEDDKDQQQQQDGVIQTFKFGTSRTFSSNANGPTRTPSVSSNYSEDADDNDDDNDDDDDDDDDENDGVIRNFKCKPPPPTSSAFTHGHRHNQTTAVVAVIEQQQQQQGPVPLREVVDDKGRLVEHFKCSASNLHYEHDNEKEQDEAQQRGGGYNDNANDNDDDDDDNDDDDAQDGVIVHVKFNTLTSIVDKNVSNHGQSLQIALSPPSINSSSDSGNSTSNSFESTNSSDNNSHENDEDMDRGQLLVLSPPSICDPEEYPLLLSPPSIAGSDCEEQASLSPPSISEPEEVASLSPPSITDPEEVASLSPPSITDPEEVASLSPPSINDEEEEHSPEKYGTEVNNNEDQQDGVIEHYKLVMVPKTDDDNDDDDNKDDDDRSYSYYYAEDNEKPKSNNHQKQQQEYQQQDDYNADDDDISHEEEEEKENSTSQSQNQEQWRQSCKTQHVHDDEIDKSSSSKTSIIQKVKDDNNDEIDPEQPLPRHNNDSRMLHDNKHHSCDSTSLPSFHSTNSNNNHNNNNNNNSSENPNSSSFRWCPSCWILLVLALLCGITGTVFGVINYINAQNNNNTSDMTESDTNGNLPLSKANATNATTTIRITTLDEIYQRGTLLCGLPFVNSPGFLQNVSNSPQYEQDWIGFDIELCKAISAAIFGKPNFVSVTMSSTSSTSAGSERWKALASKEVDLVLRSTHTMQRDIYMAEVGTGFSFSQPYFYDGLMFGGIPPFTACAENQNTSGECESLRICVHAGTTHYDIVSSMFTSRHVKSMPDMTSLFASLSDETCNVIAWESHGLTPSSVILNGYTDGLYEMGTRYFSREPLAIATRQDDVEWTDFVFWLLQALLTAEEHGITQATAMQGMPTTNLFGERYKDMFRNAVGASGSYGEIYSKTLQDLIPRSGRNELNRGSNGLLYSFPFGSMDSVIGPDIDEMSPTVRAIRQRGFLNCGINSRNGFANFDTQSKTWSGFDVDLCRAISAAIFQGVDHLVVYTDLPAAQRFQVLQDGRVDVLARLTTWTMERDVLQPMTAATTTTGGGGNDSGQGFTFSTPYFHDSVTFAGVPNYVTCAMNMDVASTECQDLMFCLVEGSTAHYLIEQLFHKRYYTTKLVYDEIIDALNDGSCNAIAGGSFDVAVATVEQGGYFGEYQVGDLFFNETFTTGELLNQQPLSKDPLSIVTRQDDVAWSDFCQWIFWSLVYAEEHNITQATAVDIPMVTLFGSLHSETFYHAVNTVGNYGELYERNFATIVPRTGLNNLNDQNGPQMFTIPGIDVITTTTNG